MAPRRRILQTADKQFPRRRAGPVSHVPCGAGSCVTGYGRQRQPDLEPAARPGVDDPYPAVMGVDDAAHDREPETRAAGTGGARLRAAPSHVEDLGQLGFGDAP